MKKKIYFILIEMFMVIVLVCACSGGQKTEETPESRNDEPTDLIMSEQSDAETDDMEVDNAEMDGVQPDNAETGNAMDDAGNEDAADGSVTPDLNHNGIAEEIRLTDIDDEQGQRLEIWEGNERIVFKTGYYAHLGQSSIFLCTLEGKDYLLKYDPTMYQGVCIYSYVLSDLTDNKESVVQWDRVDFDINFGSPIHNDFEPEAIAAFMDEINELLSHSTQMLNTNSELLATFEKEGELYDSLWWLDNWEPEFVRDEGKSLQENLEDFRAAMLAIQKPLISEEVDALPITEPLEMAFYSGAGGWGTYITLHPDGSFVGDYADADVDEIFVCQFHGQFGDVEKLTDSSWLMTLKELELDTGHSVGEEWDEADGDHMIHYVAREPYGFDDREGVALKPGAQFILYSPEATGHEPGTELYGALEFQSWTHDHREFNSSDVTLGCWGLQNIETGRGFFSDLEE